MPIVVDREKEKKYILSMFHECCKEKSISNVSLRDVAKKANMNHQKILYYFHSKEDLLLEYIYSFYDIYQGNDKIFKRNLSTKREIIDAIIDYLFEIDKDNSYNVIFTQILTLAFYNPKIKIAKEYVYKKWQDYIIEVFEKNCVSYTSREIQAILMLMDGLLLDNQENTLTNQNVKKIINSLFEF